MWSPICGVFISSCLFDFLTLFLLCAHSDGHAVLVGPERGVLALTGCAICMMWVGGGQRRP